jgi:hypothetical protein
MEEWRNGTLTGNLEVDAVPGVGPATIRKLKASGVSTTYALLGRYLQHRGPGVDSMAAAHKFKRDLADWDTPKKYQDTVVTAVVEKLMAGFKLTMTGEFSSGYDHHKMEEILATPLTGDLAVDFKGISPKTAASMAKKWRIENTTQFFGVALQFNDAGEFQAELKALGVNASWSGKVVHQVVDRLWQGLEMGA